METFENQKDYQLAISIKQISPKIKSLIIDLENMSRNIGKREGLRDNTVKSQLQLKKLLDTIQFTASNLGTNI